jgi:hypothetical protein
VNGFFGQTAPKRITVEEEREVEATSELLGFRRREPLKAPPRRNRGTTKQLHNFTMRLDIDDAETFIRWCERERIAYREGFARLVATIDKE